VQNSDPFAPATRLTASSHPLTKIFDPPLPVKYVNDVTRSHIRQHRSSAMILHLDVWKEIPVSHTATGHSPNAYLHGQSSADASMTEIKSSSGSCSWQKLLFIEYGLNHYRINKLWCESTTGVAHRAVSPNWPKIESGRSMVTPHLPWKFHANRSSRFLVILLTKKQRKIHTIHTKKNYRKQYPVPRCIGDGVNIISIEKLVYSTLHVTTATCILYVRKKTLLTFSTIYMFCVYSVA